ncbi:MAG: hypothetical protein PHV97_01045 [Candidatus Omnitrophica bacterium]|nr:hypothetical protein [Candidatus Omnitrophota bacterium]
MGKFGIILAFLISVAAAGGSYYLYQGWVEERTVRSSVEAKYDQVKEKMITVQSEKEQIKAEKEQISARSEEYRTKAEAMQAQLEKLQTEQSRIDSEKTALEKQLKSHQEMIAELQAKMAGLEKKAKEAQAACGVTPADMKTDPFSAPQPFTSSTTSGPSGTTSEGGSGTSQLVFKPVTSGGSGTSVTAPGTPMPPVASAKPSGAETVNVAPAAKEESVIAAAPAPETPAVSTVESSQSPESSATAATTTGAKVLTVNRKFNFVVINQGLQEGLKMGDKLKVLKQDKEVATVQIEKLYDKFSAATLVEEDPKQQVVEGDEIRKA